jgi:hypothetical protein
MSLEKEFVPYEIALDMKSIEFDEPCLGYYIELKNPVEGLLKIGLDNDYLQAPLYQQAFSWFREKYDIHSQIYSDASGDFKFYIDWGFGMHTFKDVYSYEEAELECLKKLIKIVKNEKNNN